MHLPAVEAFLMHYVSILDFLEALKDDASEPADNRTNADSFLQNLEKFQTYYCLRVIQKLFQMVNPTHKMYQSRKATTGEVKDWVNSLVVSLSAESVNLANAESLYDCKSIKIPPVTPPMPLEELYYTES